MKILPVAILCTFFNSYYQNKEKVIFPFEDGKDTIIVNSRQDLIYKIDGKHSFIFYKNKHEKAKVDFYSIRKNLVTFNEFLGRHENRNYMEVFNNYDFYILLKEEDSSAYLVQVEKVWLVEHTIVD